MNLKWYISFLVIILSILGSVADDAPNTIPNQEIVLQFGDTTIDSDATEHTIAVVKKQLQELGSSAIQVQKLTNGQLKISYYSTRDVALIKSVLVDDHAEELKLAGHNQNDLPSKDGNVDYYLDVYEIQPSYDISDVEGQMTFETKWERDRSIHSNHNFTNSVNNDLLVLHNITVAYQCNAKEAIEIDDRSRSIPEVRAGPIV